MLVNESISEVKCNCQRMESFGIPCEHIVVLLVYLGMNRLPESTILQRWTKTAKDDAEAISAHGSGISDAIILNRY